MNKTGPRASRPPGWIRAIRRTVYDSIGARLLVLLLIAEAPLLVFAVVLTLHNDRLRASDAISRLALVQSSALAALAGNLRTAEAIAGAIAAAPPGVLAGAGCADLVKVAARVGEGRATDIEVAEGSAILCSTALDVPPQAWPPPPSNAASLLIGRNAAVYLIRRLPKAAAGDRLVVVRLQPSRAAPPSPGGGIVPQLLLWVRQGADWLPVDDRAGGAQPLQPEHLPAGAGAVRLPSRDGRPFLYTAAAAPAGIGQPGGVLVAGSDIRGAAIAAGRTYAVRLAALAAFFLSEFLLVAGGVSLVVSRPLRRLNQAVDLWRTEGPFHGIAEQAGPTEVSDLSRSFALATTSLNQREAELRGSIAQQELLMQEIHHRVKNNLQIITSLLNLQASRIKAPEARAEFQSARDRVRALATLHRHLYAHGELQMIDMGAFFTELCGQLFQAFNEVEGDRIALDVAAPGVNMSSDQAVPLALIVTEAVGNAIKYAFPDGRRGRIALTLELHEATQRIGLLICDDGVGFAATASSRGLGLQLIRGFARQLGGSLAVTSDIGTCYNLDMAIQQTSIGPRARSSVSASPANA